MSQRWVRRLAAAMTLCLLLVSLASCRGWGKSGSPGPLLEGTILVAESASGDTPSAPIPGAQVMVGDQAAEADAAGHYRLRVPIGSLRLRVEAPGYVSQDLPLEISRQAARYRMDLHLYPAELGGSVRDASNGQTLPGAQLVHGASLAVADGEGRFRLRVQPGQSLLVTRAGYHELAFTPEALQAALGLAMAGASALEIALEPWQVLLTVRDQLTGAALPGVSVSVAQPVGRRPAAITTDGRGEAAVRVRPHTSLSLSLGGYRSQTITYEGQDTLEVHLVPGRVLGRLIDGQTRESVTRATVLGWPAPGHEPVVYGVDARGAFTLPLDLAGITIKAPGYRRQAIEVAAAGTITVELTPFEVRGIYIPFGVLTRPDRMEELLQQVESSELNAIVVDVKGDRARLAWPSAVPLAQEIGAYQRDVLDLQAFVRDCHRRGIYVIARMVVFKDDLLATGRPELAIQRSDGTLYEDLEGLHWVDPFRQEVRDYNIALACEVAELDFDEVQFDYLRFPSDGETKDLEYAQEPTFEARPAAMASFCAQAHAALQLTPAFMSADVFGLTVWLDAARDMGIGQRIEDIGPYVDYLSPMLLC